MTYRVSVVMPGVTGSTFADTPELALEEARKWLRNSEPGEQVIIEHYREDNNG